MTQIRTLPVYSKLANPQNIPDEIQSRLPTRWQLSEHQLATYRALIGDADVILNTAMTGDGKSLAGQLPALIQSRSTVAMYPTNELIRDQLRQSETYLHMWHRGDMPLGRLDAQRLDELVEERTLGRANALLTFLRNYELVLTNPDIFHYIMQQYYIRTGQHGDVPDRIVGPFLTVFEQWTFDEFHVFQTPEVVAVLNALLFIREFAGTERAKKFLFLSATPSELMMRSLERAEFRVQQIEGCYMHTWQPPDPKNWRRILHGSTLHFTPQRAEEWLEEHLDDILLRFFQDHAPAAKGAIIVNSVASAQRLTERLKPVFAARGLSVASNTGFDSMSSRQESYSTDLLIGTSTIDVGVDFAINFLVFESRDAGSFLQRLGRLGRHDSYEYNGVTHRFDAFEAHALLPPWIEARLFQEDAGTAPPLADGMEIDRERFSQIIHASFPSPATFSGYGKIWGGFQAAAIIRGLYHPAIKGPYTGMRERLAEQYRKMLRVRIGQKLKELQTLDKLIVEEIRSFRGGGSLLGGVIDERETGAARIKTYDLFGLLSNFECEPLQRETFEHEAQQWRIPRRVYQADTIVGYFQVFGVRPQRKDVGVIFNQDLDAWGPQDFGVAQVGTHLEISAPNVSDVNNKLRRRSMIVLLCLGMSPQELARRLRLPQPFPLYTFRSRDSYEGCIAFGRQALLLEVALRERPDIPCGGEAQPMIV